MCCTVLYSASRVTIGHGGWLLCWNMITLALRLRLTLMLMLFRHAIGRWVPLVPFTNMCLAVSLVNVAATKVATTV
ncbi:Hypothetical Protein FCC1311_089512 [Hondaea fermentalgiana]|uniref:Uncharacterized protein n=1 Tax=Hondaea fermentalgiana TaxID=2315210 RepID=A0A2R5GPB6_9STRA|nr:Hypothetical Protein FCC1311_089512 [Hondaea fermentalgiana]|eukprot:GBG32726.1 Hypothetical Protein FCC1311_089512 [Hondaea fermentalgiana]